MAVRDADFEDVDPGEARILLPPGDYPARFLSYEAREYVFRVKRVEKLIMCWEVSISPDDERKVLLHRFCNVARNKANRFKFGALSAFRKDWVAANGGRVPLDPRKKGPRRRKSAS